MAADSNNDYDLVIIGSGPGGYVAAIRASQLGMKTAVIERESLGGVCLNWGCIPTKALLRSAEVLRLAQHADAFGVVAPEVSFDLGKMVKRSRDVAGRLSSGVGYLMKKNKIDVIRGEARLEAGETVPAVLVESEDGTETYRAPHVIVATGARAREMPDFGLAADGDRVWTYREAMVPDETPGRLLVIGSGAIGVEFASFYAALGSDVTVVEVMDQILPAEDDEISGLARKAFEKDGIQFLTGARVQKLAVEDDGVAAEIETGGEVAAERFDRAILAIGIVGNTDGLGLEGLGAEFEKTHLVVDGFGRTNVPGLYAIGDVTGPPWLAHKASHEGVNCVEGIAGANEVHPFDASNVPGCTYSHPQIASVGMTEREARESGRDIKVGRFPYAGNGKAIALGDDQGLVKTIFDKETGELLGAHMVGAEVTELIQGYVIAREGELVEEDLLHTVFPHPTLSETMHEAVLDAEGRVIHI